MSRDNGIGGINFGRRFPQGPNKNTMPLLSDSKIWLSDAGVPEHMLPGQLSLTKVANKTFKQFHESSVSYEHTEDGTVIHGESIEIRRMKVKQRHLSKYKAIKSSSSSVDDGETEEENVITVNGVTGEVTFSTSWRVQEIADLFRNNMERITTVDITNTLNSYVRHLGGFHYETYGWHIPCEPEDAPELLEKCKKLIEALKKMNPGVAYNLEQVWRTPHNREETGRHAELYISEELDFTIEALSEQLKEIMEKKQKGEKIRNSKKKFEDYEDVAESANVECIRLGDILSDFSGSVQRIEDKIFKMNEMMAMIRSEQGV